MTYDPYSLCQRVGVPAGEFEADPAVVFPTTLARIQEVLAGAPPHEIVTPGWIGRAEREPVADTFLRQAEALPADAWGLETDDRPHALDLAESWFKRALVLRASRGIRLHLSRNDEYRR
ncbi:MAG: hypothetical protein IT318_23750 [Anaerolineales bacterium]|nr:hypothetical protein [Anaerolineales bacterium]